MRLTSIAISPTPVSAPGGAVDGPGAAHGRDCRAWPQHAHLPYERKGLKVDDRWAQRRTAAALLAAVLAHRSKPYFRRATVLPVLVATLADGTADRLWLAALVFYLNQIAETTTPPAAARRRDR